MAKGIIYVMTTVVPGLVKIGKTNTEQFENRMYNLERHGYNNVGGLQRKFAIEVDNYDEKEKLIGDIFSKSRVINSELFALDVDIVIQLLSSLEGKQIFPKDASKGEIFAETTEELQEKNELSKLPDGTYYLSRKVKGFGAVSGTMVKKDGKLIVQKGSKCAPTKAGGYVHSLRKKAVIVNNILQESIDECTAVSAAGWIILGKSNDGWAEWKNENGEKIQIYR